MIEEIYEKKIQDSFAGDDRKVIGFGSGQFLVVWGRGVFREWRTIRMILAEKLTSYN